MLTQSVQSTVDFEDRTVFAACCMFVDALHNCAPFAATFRNKPKALAIMEIAMQRETTGSAVLVGQVTREDPNGMQSPPISSPRICGYDDVASAILDENDAGGRNDECL